MTRQVPEPGQGIIMWKSNRKEDERKMDGSMFIGTWWSLIAAAALQSCLRFSQRKCTAPCL